MKTKRLSNIEFLAWFFVGTVGWIPLLLVVIWVLSLLIK